MNSKDKVFLKKFCVKESNNIIDQEKFSVKEFPIKFSINEKMTKPPPIKDTPAPSHLPTTTKFSHPTHNVFTPLSLLEMGH